MALKRRAMTFTRLLLAMFTIVFSAQVFALSDEDVFQHAREAYAAGNEKLLTEDLAKLKSRQYILAPYADYWLMLLKMSEARDEELQNFLAQYVDMPFADRVRGEWLKKLAKNENWDAFFSELNHFERSDVAVDCYALYGHVKLGDAGFSGQIKPLWMSSTDLASNCNQLFDLSQKNGILTNEDIWARLRLVLQDGKLELAKSVISRLPNTLSDSPNLLDKAYQDPQMFLNKKMASFKTRFGAEANLYAIDRLARTNLNLAITTLNKTQGLFDADNRAFAWGRIAYHAARAHHPRALEFYALADTATLNKEQLAWKVRMALRMQNWPLVLKSIIAMSPQQQEENAWRYWRARALKEAGNLSEANVILSKLATERHYYGWLAAEDLTGTINSQTTEYRVNDAEVTSIANQAGIKRAIELRRLDKLWEAQAEWIFATRDYDDKQLLAAAEYAMRQKWYDVAINTADSTKQMHDFNLRYPTPYRDLFSKFSSKIGVDEAWAYGISRQESRFMHYAKSGVGAAGLMQIMPKTAKWIAKRIGMTGYHNGMIQDLSTNIEFGIHYMDYTLNLMKSQTVMATAAYNAGPSRAERWQSSEPLEAAIYIESIPFEETRNYVQKVMANAQLYSQRLVFESKLAKIQSLKSRLGVIPAAKKTEAPVSNDEN